MRPNFLVVGAQKCATSTLCEVLGSHPDVFMTDPKEPYFFSHDEVFSRGWKWYESLFAGAAGRRMLGEGSTTYSQRGLYPAAAERIAQGLPGVRVLYIVRHPLQRIESHWMHLRAHGGRETRPFAQALRERPEYIDNTLYLRQIDVYRALLGEDRTLVLFLEDLRADQPAVLRRCFEFLGVPPDAPLAAAGARLNVSEEKRVDTPLLRPFRRVPLFGALRDAVPPALREPFRRILKKPIEGRPEWSDDSRRWAIARLRDDNRAFLRRSGKPDDFWGIDWDA